MVAAAKVQAAQPAQDMTRKHWKVILGGALGTVFEFYDFVLFGFLSPVIAAKFFAALSPSLGFIFALLAFSVAYAVRPLGAFVFGVVMPRQNAAALTHDIVDRLEQVSVLLMLPVFFVITGLSVNVGAIGLAGLGELALILVVAVSGKFIGAFGAARLQRVPRRQATALAALMNTRGLTELVTVEAASRSAEH